MTHIDLITNQTCSEANPNSISALWDNETYSYFYIDEDGLPVHAESSLDGTPFNIPPLYIQQVNERGWSIFNTVAVDGSYSSSLVIRPESVNERLSCVLVRDALDVGILLRGGL